MTREPFDSTRLARYLAGESPPEESAEIRHWLEEHPSDAEVITALRAATEGLVPSRAVDVERALRRVKARARANARPLPWRAAALAAAAVIIIAVGVFLTNRSRQAAMVQSAYQTRTGERDTVRLADGSVVYLAPASRLVITGRQAELQGEAYFDIVHDARDPFTVRSGDIEIRDVGTRFAVHGVSGEPVRVVVTEGSVQVRRADQSVVLGRGDVAVAQEQRILASRGAANEDDIAWLHGRLVFRDAPLSRVAAELDRWYGVQLLVKDSALLDRHFTGSFLNESADRIADVVALAIGARAEHRGDTITIATPPASR